MARTAIFLDRDGTLIEEVGYLGDPEGVVLLPGVPEALRRLHEAGHALILVSNQAGVARGLFTEDDVRAVNARLESLLARHDVALDAWYWCTHHPDVTGPCDCRKPATGMLERAAREHEVDLAGSWMVGDHPSDVECARRAGARGILVLTGHAGHGETGDGALVADDLSAAAELILTP